MTPEQKVAYTQGMVACLLSELESMKAANFYADQRGEEAPHKPDEFMALPNKYGVHHNALIELFHSY